MGTPGRGPHPSTPSRPRPTGQPTRTPTGPRPPTIAELLIAAGITPARCHGPCPPKPTAGGGEAPAPPSAGEVAQLALDQVTLTIPRPHTSPDDVDQITGLKTWFWMDPDEWVAASARAELPGIWAEVTATPAVAVWTPGDGSPSITCTGPGRPHPGTPGATTDCGHVYTDVGTYSLRVEVTYRVTWRASTGETGTQDALVLTTEVPLTVAQRQVVTS